MQGVSSGGLNMLVQCFFLHLAALGTMEEKKDTDAQKKNHVRSP